MRPNNSFKPSPLRGLGAGGYDEAIAAAAQLPGLTQALGRMHSEISKFQAACEQLDWAVRLFLDHCAYIPVITLAGAAEEILGEPLKNESAFSTLKENLAREFDLPQSVVSQQHLNQAKNWLKHWRDMEDPDRISLDLRNEAIQQLARAFSNLMDHDAPLSDQALRFIQWVKKERAA